MPYNGTGVFTQLHNWITDKANGVFVTASRFQATYDDMAQALSNCVTRDGQSPVLANLNMSGFKILNLANGVAASDAVNLGQLNAAAGAVPYLMAASRTGTTQVIPISFPANILFNSVVADPFSEYNPASGVFTAHAAGLYLINAGVNCVSSVANGINISIASGLDAPAVSILAANATIPQLVNLSGALRLTAGQTVSIQVGSSGVGNITINFGSSCFQVAKMGN